MLNQSGFDLMTWYGFQSCSSAGEDFIKLNWQHGATVHHCDLCIGCVRVSQCLTMGPILAKWWQQRCCSYIRWKWKRGWSSGATGKVFCPTIRNQCKLFQGILKQGPYLNEETKKKNKSLGLTGCCCCCICSAFTDGCKCTDKMMSLQFIHSIFKGAKMKYDFKKN